MAAGSAPCKRPCRWARRTKSRHEPIAATGDSEHRRCVGGNASLYQIKRRNTHAGPTRYGVWLCLSSTLGLNPKGTPYLRRRDDALDTDYEPLPHTAQEWARRARNCKDLRWAGRGEFGWLRWCCAVHDAVLRPRRMVWMCRHCRIGLNCRTGMAWRGCACHRVVADHAVLTSRNWRRCVSGWKPARSRRGTRRPAFACTTSRNRSRMPSACATRWKVCASCCSGWASSTCRRVPSIRRRISRHRRISATTSASWRRTPLARRRARSRSGPRMKAESGSKE